MGVILENPKLQTYKNPKYESYIRSKPCLLCFKESICHHEQGLGIGLVGGGMSKKCSSLAGIPLCAGCHSRRHDSGYISFWLEFGGFLGDSFDQPRVMADGVVMREIISLQMEWIERTP